MTGSESFFLEIPVYLSGDPRASHCRELWGSIEYKYGLYTTGANCDATEHRKNLMYKFDESWLSSVAGSTSIMSHKGKAEGFHIIIGCCNSAGGQYIPPLVIYKGVRI